MAKLTLLTVVAVTVSSCHLNLVIRVAGRKAGQSAALTAALSLGASIVPSADHLVLYLLVQDVSQRGPPIKRAMDRGAT